MGTSSASIAIEALDSSSLAALLLGSFLAATILPGGSELLLAAVLAAHPERVAVALVVATVGNTLGALTSYALGRGLWHRPAIDSGRGPAQIARLGRWGPPLLLLSWLPLIGDAFCVAAGWLRLPFLPCLLYIATGKFLRYLAVAQATRVFAG